MLFPAVFNAVAHENEVIVTQNLHRVAHDAPRAAAHRHKVQLILVVAVNRVGEAVFVPVYQIKAIFLREGSYFGYNLVHRY